MIVAERKPLKEILSFVEDADRIAVVGCGTCVAVCMAGGEKEVGLLAMELRMALELRGRSPVITEETVQRQCEEEFVAPLEDLMATHDVIVSIGCGAGVQFLAARFAKARLVPGLNTQFIGVVREPGEFTEFCQACGDCTLHLTGGICPIARCSKSLLNGPCGGSSKGHCEIDESVECAWQLIYDKLKAEGRLHLLEEIRPVKNWRNSRDGGPRRTVREEYKK